MELRKITIAVMSVAGVSFFVAAGPATAPSPTPTTAPPAKPMAVPSTRPVVKPQTFSSSDNSNNSRRDRTSRRGRGNRDSAPVVSASDPYAVLDTRSIFIKGDQTTASSAPRVIGDIGSGGFLPNRQASALIFNGVILVNDEALAMIEDSYTGNVVKVHAGDLISGGRVTGITFGDLAYEASGQTRHVEIGQTLEGQAPSSSSYSPPVAAGPTSMPAGGLPATGTPAGPVTSSPGSSTAGLSQDDILAKLKARRAAEAAGAK